MPISQCIQRWIDTHLAKYDSVYGSPFGNAPRAPPRPIDNSLGGALEGLVRHLGAPR